MKGTLLFVHGTGVRREGLDATLDRIVEACDHHGLGDVDVRACRWGEEVGPTFDGVPAALPLEDDAPPQAGWRPSPDSAAAWQLLIDDPLFELRVAAELPGRFAPQRAPNQPPPEKAAADLMANLAGLERPEHQELFERAGVVPAELRASGELIARSQEFDSAARTAGDELDGDFVESVARAVVASVLQAHRHDLPGTQPALAFRRDLRAEMVDCVAGALVEGQVMGVVSWIRDAVVGFVANRATDAVVARRGRLMDLASPALGDILYYQRRGNTIREYVDRALRDCPRPVVALGHSLGGIVLVDVLSSDNPPPVDLLVTVGSQSPLFFVIDALHALRPNAAGRPFTPWLNIYSEADLLSFCATRVFPDEDRIVDVTVDGGVPFPESHGAYWSLDEVWTTIVDAWPENQ